MILITGANGFIGSYLIQYLQNLKKLINPVSLRDDKINILNSNKVYIHLAGKAHDLKNISDPADYYKTNTDLTIKLFNIFIKSDAKVFITLSTVKAVADIIDIELTEDYVPKPITHYGKSKLLADQYILSQEIPKGKRVYILRPCMIHGPGNKGNLNLLYKLVKRGFPWPLGSFENKRSFCSIDNLCYIINELIENENIPPGIYNIADDSPVSTNELIKLISNSIGKKLCILNIPKSIIIFFFRFLDLFKLPLNSEKLNKLTETYVVSNNKIVTAINKPLPLSSKEGLMKTLNSFQYKC